MLHSHMIKIWVVGSSPALMTRGAHNSSLLSISTPFHDCPFGCSAQQYSANPMLGLKQRPGEWIRMGPYQMTSCILLMMESGTAMITIAKSCCHVISCFTTSLYSNGISNYCRNLRITWTLTLQCATLTMYSVWCPQLPM